MARLWSIIAVALLSVITGCSAKSIMDHIAPETVQEAKTNFDYLRHKQYDRIEPLLDASIDRTYLRANLDEMVAQVPAQDPVSVKTVGAYVVCDTRKGCDTRVTLEYEFPAKWVLVQMIVHSKGESSVITSFLVQPESESLEAVNRFTLRGKQPLQYVILGAAIVSIVLMIDALVLCIRTPMRKRKWLWIIVILLGVGKIAANWTTGQASYNIFWINILPAGFGAELYGAWFVTVSFPLGAILFILFRNRLRKQEAHALSTESAPPAITTN